VTLNLDFKVTGLLIMPLTFFDVLCAQLTRDLFAIAKFLVLYGPGYLEDVDADRHESLHGDISCVPLLEPCHASVDLAFITDDVAKMLKNTTHFCLQWIPLGATAQ